MRFAKPVEIELHGLGKYRAVATVQDAAYVLLHLWPVDEGKAYARAKVALINAYEGKASVEAAREAFVKAVEEAGLIMRE